MILPQITLYWHWWDQSQLFFLGWVEHQVKEQLIPILDCLRGSNTQPPETDTILSSHFFQAKVLMFANFSMKTYVVGLFVLRFYGPVNPMWSWQVRPVYLTTVLLGRLSPLRYVVDTHQWLIRRALTSYLKSDHSGQTALLHRLIWHFVVHTCVKYPFAHKAVFKHNIIILKDNLKDIFWYFWEKIRLDISCESWFTWNVKSYFLWKIIQKIECHLLQCCLLQFFSAFSLKKKKKKKKKK